MGLRCDRETNEEHDKDCVDVGFQLTRAKLEGGGGSGGRGGDGGGGGGGRLSIQ